MDDFNILSDCRLKVMLMIKVTASEVEAWWQGCSTPHRLVPLRSGALRSIFYFSLSVMKCYLKEK